MFIALPFTSCPAHVRRDLIAKLRAFCFAIRTAGESHACAKYFFSSFANSLGAIEAPDSLRSIAVIKSFFLASSIF